MSEHQHQPPPEDGEEQDDAIIARVFRQSMVALTLGIAVVLATVWVLRGQDRQAPVAEARPEAARAGPATESAPPPTVRFVDIAAEAGVGFRHINGAYGERLLPETMGGGVAFLDYDGDGDQDLLFVNGRGWPWHDAADTPPGVSLYRNDGRGQFADVTAGSGLEPPLYGMGVAVGDYDADGRPDVLVTAVGANRLYRNLGEGQFAETGAALGVAGAADAWSTGAAFLDYDRDGDLDLFVANYVQWSREIDIEVDYRLAGIGRAYGPPTNYAGTYSWLYRNDGAAGFAEVGATAGIRIANPATGLPAGKGLGVLVADIDDDSWPDIVVANDTVQNFLFHNRGDGSFTEIGSETGIAFDSAGSATGAMGIDSTRLNGDRDLAVAIGNFANEMTSFYVAPDGSQVFTDEAVVSGIGPDSRRSLSFGLFFFDYDLDGREDLFQCNGHVENEINLVQSSQQYRQPAQLFWNCGTECPRPFVHLPDSAVGDLARPVAGRGAAFADIDADGDLDLVVTQVAGPALLLRNDQALGHHWIRLRLSAQGGNRDALGARVTISAGEQQQTRWVTPAGSYLSHSELPLTFGLGEYAGMVQVHVRWPDGSTQQIDALAIDVTHRIEQTTAGGAVGPGNPARPGGS